MSNRILLICSGGGHLVQMSRLAPAIPKEDHLILATVGEPGSFPDRKPDELVQLPDFNRQSWRAALAGIPRVFFSVLRLRPTHVISTGAAPGVIGILAGRACGARTLWIDSIANTRRLSVSGRIALICSSEVYTQWEALSHGQRPAYKGRVI